MPRLADLEQLAYALLFGSTGLRLAGRRTEGDSETWVNSDSETRPKARFRSSPDSETARIRKYRASQFRNCRVFGWGGVVLTFL